MARSVPTPENIISITYQLLQQVGDPNSIRGLLPQLVIEFENEGFPAVKSVTFQELLPYMKMLKQKADAEGKVLLSNPASTFDKSWKMTYGDPVPTDIGYPIIGQFSNDPATPCSVDPAIYYINHAGLPVVGDIIYTDSELLIPATGNDRFAASDGDIFTVDPLTGELLTNTGVNCNTPVETITIDYPLNSFSTQLAIVQYDDSSPEVTHVVFAGVPLVVPKLPNGINGFYASEVFNNAKGMLNIKQFEGVTEVSESLDVAIEEIDEYLMSNNVDKLEIINVEVKATKEEDVIGKEVYVNLDNSRINKVSTFINTPDNQQTIAKIIENSINHSIIFANAGVNDRYCVFAKKNGVVTGLIDEVQSYNVLNSSVIPAPLRNLDEVLFKTSYGAVEFINNSNDTGIIDNAEVNGNLVTLYPIFGDPMPLSNGQQNRTTNFGETNTTVNVYVTGNFGSISCVDSNGVVQSQVFSGAGTYLFSGVAFNGKQNVVVTMNEGAAPTESTFEIQNACLDTGRITGINVEGSPIALNSGAFPVLNGENAESEPYVADTYIVAVSCDGNAGSVKIVDSDNTIHCQNYSGAGIYTFPGIVVHSGQNVNVLLDSGACL